jgi:hypothetical protein
MTEGFVARELSRIEAAIASEHKANGTDTTRFRELFAAQQALGWALDPQNFKAPLDTIDRVPSQSVSRPPTTES